MTEPLLANAISASALAEYLTRPEAGSAPADPLAPYLGALTVQRFDAPEAETRALLAGVAVHDLGWLRKILVRGEDRERWLSGMVTNAVESLPNQTGAYNLVLNAQGRIQGDGYVWRDGDALELAVTAEQSEALLGHFDKFIIMDDVELITVESESALGLTGPEAESVLSKIGLRSLGNDLSISTGTVDGIPVRLFRSYGKLVPHYILWANSDKIPHLWQALVAAGATPVGSDALETLRIVEGIPAYGIDIQSRDLAQETAQDRALNFTKGCYLGQEIVERVRSRGQVHRHLRALELKPDSSTETPAVGTEIRIAGAAADSKPVVTLTSIAEVQLDDIRRIFAIGMVRAEAEVGKQALVYPGGTATILFEAPKLVVA
jgi:folate-binding protein YgfZ